MVYSHLIYIYTIGGKDKEIDSSYCPIIFVPDLYYYKIKTYLNVSWLWSYVALNFAFIKKIVTIEVMIKTSFINVLYVDTYVVNKSR